MENRLARKRLYLFCHLAELFSGTVTYETISWPFFSESPVSLLEKQMENQNRQKVLTNVGCQKWLQKNYTIVSLNTFIYKNNSILEKNIYFIYLRGCTQKVDFFIFKKSFLLSSFI